MFHKRPQLAPPNVPTDWVQSNAWISWEAPLNVVHGESHRQEAIAQFCGPRKDHGYLVPVCAILRRERNNPVDRNAIRVDIGVTQVGYIAKEFASQMSPLLDKGKCNEFTVAGVITGGAFDAPSFGVHLWLDRRVSPGPSIQIEEDIRLQFGVWWEYDPRRAATAEPTRGNEVSGTRTLKRVALGRWTAFADSELLSRVKLAREFLQTESDPLERHFAFNVLEEALYKCRDAFPSARDEFEATCEKHHQEMGQIHPGLRSLIGGVPFLPTYKQIAIMKTKSKDYAAAEDWCRCGLAVYGDDALESEGIDDLNKRLAKLINRKPT